MAMGDWPGGGQLTKINKSESLLFSLEKGRKRERGGKCGTDRDKDKYFWRITTITFKLKSCWKTSFFQQNQKTRGS